QVGAALLPLFAPGIAPAISATRRVFPLGFAGQPVTPPRLLAQPGAIGARVPPTHLHDRVVVLAYGRLAQEPAVRRRHLRVALEVFGVVAIGDRVFADAVLRQRHRVAWLLALTIAVAAEHGRPTLDVQRLG